LSPREIVFGVLFIDEQVVSHDEPGAADHSSVQWDFFFIQPSPIQDLVLVTIYF